MLKYCWYFFFLLAMRNIGLLTFGFIIFLLRISSSFSSRYTLEEDLCLTIVLSRAQNFCINRCKQKRLRILWYPVLAKNETNGAKDFETFTIHAYFIADFPRLNFLYHTFKKVFFTNSQQLFLSIFRECVRNLDLRVQVHPGELWVSKSAGSKGDVLMICGFEYLLHPL